MIRMDQYRIKGTYREEKNHFKKSDLFPFFVLNILNGVCLQENYMWEPTLNTFKFPHFT